MENTIHLMIVDDEDSLRETLTKRLRKRGMSVEQADSGDACLALLEKVPADVIISDVKMPGMNGLELLRHIKSSYPKIEVILLTAHASATDGVEGMKSGAFDYVTKPVEFDYLVSKINQAYDKILRAEEKEKEAEFREKMEKQMILTERLASLGTLATGVAHEINNPLAIIKEASGWMSLILKKEELADMPRKADFEKALSKIETGVERARRITHQLLEFAPKSESVFSEVDARELVKESLQLLNREAANKDIEIVRETDPALKNIWSDPYRLRQILVNLITNAIHATGRGGKITIGAKPAGQGIELSVADTGEGIPKENLKRIFEPFFSTKNPGKGTGLGLFVTRGLADKLGGHIEVESEVGKGSVFRITLPLQHETEEPLKKSEEDRFNVMSTILNK